MIEEKYLKRFWAKVDIKDNKEECWLWTASKQGNDGRGCFRCPYGSHAHRLAYYFTFGKDPGELYVLHKCDTPSCCNPYHLFLGTQKDNMEDCVKKGRFKSNKGSKNPNASLTEEEVSHIKSLIRQGIDNHIIFKMYDKLSKNQMHDIRRNRKWQHVA